MTDEWVAISRGSRVYMRPAHTKLRSRHRLSMWGKGGGIAAYRPFDLRGLDTYLSRDPIGRLG